ncbi:DUF4173 domain-containing protein [bacterium]|nr:DUF4173 domain-containing protein [bacterium]MCB2179009.1 DUF4173 domain-containing protein [bacterium]
MSESPASTEKAFTLKRKSVFIWTALFVGWLFDFLFYDKVPGISIVIFILVMLGAGFFLAQQQGLKPARSTLWLLVPILFFTAMTILRLEPMTTFLNMAAAVFLMGLLAHSFLGGKWWQYRFKDYLSGSFFLGLDALIRPVVTLLGGRTSENSEDAEPAPDSVAVNRQGLSSSLSVLRGLLIALPIVLVFAAILAEADPIFDDLFGQFLDLFKIENIGEYIGRAILIVIVANIVLGVILHALYKNHDDSISGDNKRWLPAFLGMTESGIILGSVNLLFLVFVVIQFQYFFGGQQNIHLDGFTYAEYARRGFAELVIVAIFSLLLFLGLSFLTRREKKRSQGIFSALSILLFALVIVILVSSLQRMLLYEQAYGFSRLRTYTHVFIYWLGALLIVVSLLELLRKQRYFALAVLTASLGFVASLNIVNVDAFIVQRNVERLEQGEPLDIAYLASLNEDALPALADAYAQAENTADQQAIAGAIACHAALNDDFSYQAERYSWRSFHFSRSQAQSVWENVLSPENEGQFSVHNDSEDGSRWDSYVIINGEQISCYGIPWD